MPPKPTFKFNPDRWAEETQTLSLAARGAWIELQREMWLSQTRGQITATVTDLARLLRASVDQARTCLQELVSKGVVVAEAAGQEEGCNAPCSALVTLEVTQRVTLACPWMWREEKRRQQTRLRVRRHRKGRACNAACNAGGNADVTQDVSPSPSPASPPLPSPPTPPLSCTPPPPPPSPPSHTVGQEADSARLRGKAKKGGGGGKTQAIEQEFETWFWPSYPREGRRNASKAKARTAYRRARRKVSLDTIRAGLEAMVRQWENRHLAEFVPRPPMPATWLNQERWDADYSLPAAGDARRPAKGAQRPAGQSLWDVSLDE